MAARSPVRDFGVAERAVDRAVERSAAPAAVAIALDSLAGSRPGLRDRLEDDPELLHALVAVTGASRFLTRLLSSDPGALGVLTDLDRPVAVVGATVEDLSAEKQRELLRIAARDLAGLDVLEAVGMNLARLADDVLVAAVRLAGTDASGLGVVGMGKLGGRELNYASDVDVLFVGEGEARRLMDVARTCFRVDADLRPEGRSGPLVRSVASYEAYWDRWASTWEFQALLKARAVAGRPDVGAAFLAAASARVWRRPFGADELHEVRAMKARTEELLAKRGLLDREVKRGRGGIRDIEFAVQLLQLVHGRHDTALRSPTTLTALRDLADADYVGTEDAAALADAYRFLRTVEHRLQLVEGQQVHAVPAAAEARAHLARVMGQRDDAVGTALTRFDTELRRHQATVRSIHERLFFRPLLEAFTGVSPMPPEAVQARLAAFGFTDAQRTRQALAELTRGITRSSRLMQQMLALLLGWLSESPDPDLGLLGLRTLATGQHRGAQLVASFRESPEAARRLCLLLGTSPLLRSGFEHHPELIPALGSDAAMAAADRADLSQRARSSLAWRGGAGERRRGLHRLRRAEFTRIAARDVIGLAGLEATSSSLTVLAEAVLEAALDTVEPSVPMAVVAMGRFGGAELSYGSDLDVLIVYAGSTAEDFAAAEQAAGELLRFVNGTTPAERIFAVDAGLRPEGRDGPLARSLEGYRTYHRRWAQTWERQALLRARVVAGDPDVGSRFMELVGDVLWGAPITDDQVREIRRMKARIERERIPPGDDPQFHLKLGRGSLSDVEWTAQLLQLSSGVAASGTMEALRRLTATGAIASGDAAVLAEAYRFCEQVRNRWFLVKGAPGDALPAQADQLARLARSCGTSAATLREDYRRVTRRARAVVERLFYGRGQGDGGADG
ncbi:MAG TPA: bifunctional [glutamine synthetase] adenylyltransferase/[glutamine synthetase]-adenylyl-L-tyrosine phosphorylase [Acidimicrobiales bacterium]|nr:bifunctional [glutamine synthetase] adenylyltransferase/[glutamine synthetase]-adenylyl-L-tyrosine phosphorylase [Acidimicrobiales bacterium]